MVVPTKFDKFVKLTSHREKSNANRLREVALASGILASCQYAKEYYKFQQIIQNY